MAIKDLTDNEIAAKLKDLNGMDSAYPDVVKQYFQELFNRFYHQCYNLSRYYGLERHDAEDIVQESFVKMLKRIRSYDDNKSFKPWFFKVILNSVRDRYTELKKHRYTDLELLSDVPNPDQEKFIEEFPIQDSFRSIINRLPEKLKNIVLLRNYADMDLESISKTVQLSVRQVHNLLSQAYDIIKKALEEHR